MSLAAVEMVCWHKISKIASSADQPSSSLGISLLPPFLRKSRMKSGKVWKTSLSLSMQEVRVCWGLGKRTSWIRVDAWASDMFSRRAMFATVAWSWVRLCMDSSWWSQARVPPLSASDNAASCAAAAVWLVCCHAAVGAPPLQRSAWKTSVLMGRTASMSRSSFPPVVSRKVLIGIWAREAVAAKTDPTVEPPCSTCGLLLSISSTCRPELLAS